MERPQKQKKFRKRKQSSPSRNDTFNSNFANLANTRKSLPQQQPDIQEESEYTASESDISSQYSASVSSRSSKSSRGSRRSRKNKQNFSLNLQVFLHNHICLVQKEIKKNKKCY